MVTSAGLQRPAEDRRGAAGAREVRLRDDRAGEGHRDDPVADPPLPVPAGPAGPADGLHGGPLPAGEGRRGSGRPGVRDPGRWRLGPRLAVGPRPAHRRDPATRASPTRVRRRCSGFTDGELLDATIDALAAGDGAAVFTQVDKVIESGHDPRRFVEDLLERLRDLIIVAAVPEGAASVLRGVPEDQLERMRGQQSRFGPGALTRAADIVNAGLTEMTGATAPRHAARADLRADPAARRRPARAGMRLVSTASNVASTSAESPRRRGRRSRLRPSRPPESVRASRRSARTPSGPAVATSRTSPRRRAVAPERGAHVGGRPARDHRLGAAGHRTTAPPAGTGPRRSAPLARPPRRVRTRGERRSPAPERGSTAPTGRRVRPTREPAVSTRRRCAGSGRTCWRGSSRCAA